MSSGCVKKVSAKRFAFHNMKTSHELVKYGNKNILEDRVSKSIEATNSLIYNINWSYGGTIYEIEVLEKFDKLGKVKEE